VQDTITHDSARPHPCEIRHVDSRLPFVNQGMTRQLRASTGPTPPSGMPLDLGPITDARNKHTRSTKDERSTSCKEEATNHHAGSKDEYCKTNLPPHHNSLSPSYQSSTANRHTSTRVLFPRTQCGNHTSKMVEMDRWRCSILSLHRQAQGTYLQLLIAYTCTCMGRPKRSHQQLR
jgi:hypothetical protein